MEAAHARGMREDKRVPRRMDRHGNDREEALLHDGQRPRSGRCCCNRAGYRGSDRTGELVLYPIVD